MTTKLILTTLLLFSLPVACDKEEDSDAADESQSEIDATQAGRGTVAVDTTAPVALASFAVVEGSRLGVVDLTWTYPEGHDYAKIEIYRKEGSLPAGCTDGTLVGTITDFTTKSYIDTALVPGAYYGYLACLSDEAGNAYAMKAPTLARASAEQRAFVTSQVYDGNLAASFQGQTFSDGISGANARCQWHADQAGLGGSWEALLSSETESAYSQVPVYEGLYLVNGIQLASNQRDLWDGELYSAIDTNENGVVEESSGVWTGTTTSGALYTNYNCNAWTSTSGGALIGNSATLPSDSSPGSWVMESGDSCANENRLYCVEVDTATYEVPALAASSSTTDGNVAVAVDFSTMGGTTLVKVARQAGRELVNDSCDLSYNAKSALRSAVVGIYNGADKTFADATISDVIDADSTSGFSNEHGYYHYIACAYDAFGNLRNVSTSDGIAVGTNFLRAFVSTNAFDGNAMSQAVANAECASNAASAGLSGTFKALVADESKSAAGNISSSSPTSRYIYDLAGNYAGRYSGSSYYFDGLSPQVTANGTVVATGTGVWTGASYNGNYSSSCASSGVAWSNTTGTGSGGIVAPVPNGYFISSLTTYCTNQYRVWCVEQN